MAIQKAEQPLQMGGKGLYPLTTADQIIKDDGNRLEVDGKINADTLGNMPAERYAIRDTKSSIIDEDKIRYATNGAYWNENTMMGVPLKVFIDDIRYAANGAMGSVYFTNNSGTSITVPAWYHYIYIPHRCGGSYGQPIVDNCYYGALILIRLRSRANAGMYIVTFDGDNYYARQI